MNDQQNPYDPYQPQPQIIGYDAYGQPVYQQQAPQQAQQQPYDPYAQQNSYAPQDPYAPQQGYAYDAYGQPVQQPAYDPYAQQPPHQQPEQSQDYAYPAYDSTPSTQQWQAAAAPAPGSYASPASEAPAAPTAAPAGVPGQRPAPEGPGEPEGGGGPGRTGRNEDRAYRTEQFSFIEEPDEDSEDVIDWLKFTESRSERREEARRRGRNRVIALVVVLVLAVAGGVGYLWSAGLLPGTSREQAGPAPASGPQKRDTIVIHLHDTKSGTTTTALLVDNATTKQGTTVLLPNAVVVADGEGAATTLGKSVEDDGSSGTREAVGNLLGAEITGTWRLDTPYLENLVEYLGGIEADTDTTVPDRKKGAAPLVEKGEKQSLNGAAAVAYATYRAPGETEADRSRRFGQVLYGVLRKMPGDPQAATAAIEYLVQILDPSLPAKDLGASLAKLGEYAKVGDYRTTVLPVGADGTLSAGASDAVVKDVLGGKVTPPETDGVPRVSVKDASGRKATEAVRAVLINGGYAFVGGTTESGTRATSQVVYGDDARKATAVEVAKTLGLPESAVTKGTPGGAAAVTVVLGRDYEVPGAS
ncbi:polydiglycosylphosphate transferase PdtA [Streptomyces gulbargensis]|uniref:Polydiglycosylphosphate transferase PdtA n=1 Tax=Streptomyces gulbargensis TaxID=364901 RepID=A0ABP7MEA1_9ACTN